MLLLLLVPGLGRAQYGTSAEPYDYLLFVPEPVNASDRVEMEESASSFSDYFRETGVGEFRGHFFTTLAEADEFIRKRRAEGKPPAFAVIDPLVSLLRYDEWRASPMLCPSYDGSITIERVVVALRSHPASRLEDLRGEKLAVVRMLAEVPDLLGLMIFDEPVQPGDFFEGLVPVESLMDCLIAVMRRQAGAALVNKGFFESASGRSRQVWKEFKVVATLPPRHMAPVLIFEETPRQVVDALRVAVLNAHNSDAGRHILEVYNIDGFEPCSWKDLEPIEGALFAKIDGTRPIPSAVPDTGDSTPAVAEDVTVESVELERDGDTGDLIAVVHFADDAPAGMAASVSLDDDPPQRLTLECATNLCVLTVPASLADGRHRLSLQLLLERGGRTLHVGDLRTYPLAD